METIHIVLCIDEKYAQHAGVTIASILHNKKGKTPIAFHIVNDGLSLTTSNMLTQITDEFGADFFSYNVDSASFNQLPVSEHISKATYFRLIITDVLPSSIKKVLYLDVDLIVRGDISLLWDTDISNYYAGAVQDIGIGDVNKQMSLWPVLGMPLSEPYFNAGVLLINVARWREESINIRIMEFITSNVETILFADQDGLNAVLWGKWVHIHPKWNVYRMAFRKYYKWGGKRELPAAVIEGIKEPCIVHFTGPIKPWHNGCPMPYVNEYYHYLSLTPWREYQPPQPTIHELLKEYRWKLRRYLWDLIG